MSDFLSVRTTAPSMDQVRVSGCQSSCGCGELVEEGRVTGGKTHGVRVEVAVCVCEAAGRAACGCCGFMGRSVRLGAVGSEAELTDDALVEEVALPSGRVGAGELPVDLILHVAHRDERGHDTAPATRLHYS